MASSYKAICERLSTETLKQELKDLEREREEKEKILLEKKKLYEQHPELNPSPDKDTYFTMEEARGLFTTSTKITIIRQILYVRETARKKERTAIILYYIHFALIIGLIYILGTISDTITKNLTGSTQTIASLALVIIPLAIIIYLYRKITKR